MKKKKKHRVTRYRTHRWIKISELKEYKKHAQISTNWNRIYSQSCILEFYTFGRSNLLFFFFLPPPSPPLPFHFILFSTPLETLKKYWSPSPTLSRPSIPSPFVRNENRNHRIFPRGKVKTTGRGRDTPLGRGQSALPPINDWQFAKIPRRFRPLGFTSLRDRTNARPSNGFAVRITLCVEAAAEKCNAGGRLERERERES